MEFSRPAYMLCSIQTASLVTWLNLIRCMQGIEIINYQVRNQFYILNWFFVTESIVAQCMALGQ